jgi:hypothetical protein
MIEKCNYCKIDLIKSADQFKLNFSTSYSVICCKDCYEKRLNQMKEAKENLYKTPHF